MQKYVIGVDTGGTYTDAVLLDTQARKIVATAKTPTTHFQLAKGIGNALVKLLKNARVDPDKIESVAVSSTLATNAVVENKGARVAVVVIGYVKHFKLPVKAVVFVKGGHNIMGEEEEPLEIDYLVQLIEKLRSEVDCYGICSAMSIKNPTHELVTEKAISMLDPKPVFCSHRISQQAGMEERAATAGLHAKLMPIMADFVAGVENALENENLDCAANVIGGNGQPLATTTAIEEAALTVASGPACSAHFGATHCRNDETALVVDVGGTTTDIAMIKNGEVVLSAEGCQIGQWKTHIAAVDMQTAGIGGDSLVQIETKQGIIVGPSRVVPLVMATKIPDLRNWLGKNDSCKLIMPSSTCNSSTTKHNNNQIVELLLNQGPVTAAQIRKATGLGGIPLEKQLEDLARKQLIEETGFTPTDALHVLGKISFGDQKKSHQGAEILGSALQLSGEEFARRVLEKTKEKIENQIIDYIVRHYWDKSLASFISARNNSPALKVDFSLTLPLIGIGAAARYLLPGVAENLKTSVVFPENCEVGNAAGAALIALNNTPDN